MRFVCSLLLRSLATDNWYCSGEASLWATRWMMDNGWIPSALLEQIWAGRFPKLAYGFFSREARDS